MSDRYYILQCSGGNNDHIGKIGFLVGDETAPLEIRFGPKSEDYCLASKWEKVSDYKQGLKESVVSGIETLNKLRATIPDMVNHPPHYKAHPSGIECIEITRHYGFNIGNAIKYLWRAQHKGAEIQDLEKAIWYIKDEIEFLKKENNK